MDIQAHALCPNVYGVFHKKALDYENILQIQNSVMNINGKLSIKILLTYDDFIIDTSDWELLKNEIDLNIEHWNGLTLSFTHLENSEFKCETGLVGGKKFKVRFHKDIWDISDGFMHVISECNDNYFECAISYWSTLKTNIDKIFFHAKCSF